MNFILRSFPSGMKLEEKAIFLLAYLQTLARQPDLQNLYKV